ncbi:hypothetical protein, partial [Agromyces humi]|uniref:hypothetical protein n=1 Tax=Agromyces humi TaxID=1766800 RepID=UPI001F19C125
MRWSGDADGDVGGDGLGLSLGVVFVRAAAPALGRSAGVGCRIAHRARERVRAGRCWSSAWVTRTAWRQLESFLKPRSA